MSTTPVLSNLWYRVETLRPKLRSHARLHRHRYRGQVWYLLQDPATGRVQRFTPAARLVITLMDGTRPVAELWDLANRRLGDDAPTQDEMIHLLGQLHATDLLQSDVTPDVAELFARGQREESTRNRQTFGNPMAIRIPLVDPDRFLSRTAGLARLIWGRPGAILWCLVVLPALFLLLPHWPELSNGFTDRVLAIDNLVVLYFVFPLVKALHEMGHAMATKAGGGEVHEMGVMLLVLLPIPYVEASAATTFRSKYQRAVVGVAGVAVELFIAALAFYLWLLVEPGLVRAILFNTMLIAGVSTLLFNGNPLLRYDAYYVLADLLEMPNLAGRSLRYWGYLFERYPLGVRDAEPPDATPGEKAWLFLYGLASSIYRVFVTIFIALFIAGQFFFIGVLLAIWAAGAMVVLPVVKGVKYLASSPRLRRRRVHGFAVVGGSLGVLVLAGVAIPIPHHTHAEGVVWLSEQALVRAGTNGFVEGFLARAGDPVNEGDPLIRSADPTLSAQVKLARARVAELEALLAMEATEDRVKAAVVREKLGQERAALAVLEGREAELVVRAKAAGIFQMPNVSDVPGRYYRKGDLMGYVIGAGLPPLVRVVVPQDAGDQVRMGTDRVMVQMMNRAHTIYRGRIAREVPAGDEYLPSKALATEGGGAIAIDPRDTKGPKALERMFQFDVLLEDAARFTLFGQRVLVRFDHHDQPLFLQWYRRLRLLFLSRFSV
ncbi:MAG: hypothetical protein AB7F35_05705 [Acetobacteraceae bacterium]